MDNCQISIAPIRCVFSRLTVFTTNPDSGVPDTILGANQPFSLRVSVEFEGAGAIALLPLAPTIAVNFYAKSLTTDPDMTLGEVKIGAIANLFSYAPTLSIASPQSIGLVPGSLYRISAVLRVGAPDYPALIVGAIEDLAIQVYELPQSASKVRKGSKGDALN
jgi:hypothetical protein